MKPPRARFVLLTLADGEGAAHVPAQLDVLVGAARPAGQLTGGRLDRLVRSLAGGFRASAVYHARANVGRVGVRATGYDDLEQALGLARTYRLELADPAGAARVVERLRDLPNVESAGIEGLATTGRGRALSIAEPPTREDVEAPFALVRSGEALAREPGDERVTVAVVDTGVSLGHVELLRKLLSGYDVVDLGLGEVGEGAVLVGDSRGRDFAPTDDVGHGSHIAGVIGAQGRQLPPGVGGASRLLPIRVLAAATAPPDGERFGVGAISEINLGIKLAVDLGADVLNLSFGTPASELDPDAPPPHAGVLGYAERAGCVLVAAAGNAGTTLAYHPAVDPRVIAVGSVALDGTRSSFSSYGEHLALCAPGEQIVGVGRRGYRRATGTSHAAPFVAGAAALLVARARAAGSTPRPEQVRAWLRLGARPARSPAVEVGAGVLDVAASLARCDDALAPAAPGGAHHREGDRTAQPTRTQQASRPQEEGRHHG